MPRLRVAGRMKRSPSLPASTVALDYGSDDEFEPAAPILLPVRSRSTCGGVGGGSSLLQTRSDHQHNNMHYRRRRRRQIAAEAQQPAFSFDDSCIGSVESSCSDSTSGGGSRSPIRRELGHDGDGLGPAVETFMTDVADANNTGVAGTPNNHMGSVRKRPSPPGATKSSDSLNGALPLYTTPSQHYRTIPSSLSFRRKKMKRTGSVRLFRRLNLSRMSVVLAGLFAMSFGMAYLSNLTGKTIATLSGRATSTTTAHNNNNNNIRKDSHHAGGAVALPPPMASAADQKGAAADVIGPVSRRRLPSLLSRMLDWTWGRATTPTQAEKAAAAAETFRTLFPGKPARTTAKKEQAQDEAVHQNEIIKPLQKDANENNIRLRGTKPKHDLEIDSADEKDQSKQIDNNTDDRKKQEEHESKQRPAPDHAPIRRRASSTSKDNGASSNAADTLEQQPAVDDDDPFHFQRHFDNAPVCHALSPDQVDFTLVTQLSLDRLWMLEHHCNRWGHDHAISMAVYVGDELGVSVQDISDQLHNMGCAVERVAVQTVSGYSKEEYPVNVLRNKALSAVKTTHVMYVDVDFWESMDLYENLQNHKDALAADPHLAVVVPAFQIARQCAEWRDCREKNIPHMPDEQVELLELMVQHVADAFDPTNAGGHGSSRYREWLDQQPGELLPIDCVKSNRYEPYIAFRYCRDLPPFQEAFTGYGKNKMTWFMQMRRAGYHISQLGHSFLVHYPHLDSKARMYWNGGQGGAPMHRPADAAALAEFKRGQVDHTFVEFRRWLLSNVPDETVLHKCADALNDDVKLWVEPSEREEEEEMINKDY